MKNLIINTCNLIFIKSATAKTSNFVECKTKASNHFVSKTKRATFSINTILLMFLLLWLASTDIKAATFTVNLITDAVDANTADSICDANLVAPGLQCTLRAAIQQANASLGVDDIAFSLGAANAINLTIGELPITSNMNINGPGARLLTVQRASGAASFRVFFVQTASTATVNISGITIANGYLTASGAGINNTGATLNLTEVTVRNNVAFGGLGGDIFNGSSGKLNLVRSTVRDNTALQGGGINNNSSTATANIVNSTISNNSANDNGTSDLALGGGIYNFAVMTIVNSTISNNASNEQGGGIYPIGSHNTGVRNTIIAGNTAPYRPDVYGTATSQGNNLVGISEGNSGFTNGVNGDKVGTAAVPLNALLGALQDNGGQTDTRALQSGSPAIDAGNNCVANLSCPSANLLQSLTTDQRGTSFFRQLDGDGNNTEIVDIGAFEGQQAAVTLVGMESDVASRPNGDGVIQSTDVAQIQRFQIGLDQPFQSNECQRADSAPRNTLGDGIINSADVTQAQRYQISLDPLTPAGGPVCGAVQQRSVSVFDEESNEISGEKFDTSVIEAASDVQRLLKVENTTGSAGQPLTVNILVNAFGDESAYGFMMTYDSSILQNPSVTIGMAGGSRLCNTTVAGIISCSINNFSGANLTSSTDQIGEIVQGSNQLLATITFQIAANASTGPTPINLTNVNASNDAAQPLTIDSLSETAAILPPTSANVVSGRVRTEDGRGVRNAEVVLILNKGETLRTRTNSFGYFKFADVVTSKTYVITASSKMYSFEPKVLNAGQNYNDLDIIGVPRKK